jgi:tRNA pseudouridine38-40 synthase
MEKAAQYLVGQHDFTTFRAKDCQSRSPIKTIHEIRFVQDGELIEVHIRAPSFLHCQVRNIVGTLALVGRGIWPIWRVKTALKAKERAAGGPTAPPHGLFFSHVVYPVREGLDHMQRKN